jgi:PAS domain S-box-containing protein
MPPATRKTALLCVGLAAAYFATGRVGLQLAGYAGSVTLVWPPAGLALAALLLYGRRLWPGIAVGSFAVNVVTTPPAAALGIALGSTLGAVTGVALLERVGFAAELRRVRDVAWLFAAAVAFPLVSASVGVASLALAGELAAEHRLAAWVWWAVGDGVGIVLIAPVLLAWLSPRPRSLPRRSRLEALALEALLASACAVVFLGAVGEGLVRIPLTFAAMPPIAWASARFGPRGAASAAVVTAAMAIVGTLDERGPFAGYALQERLLFLVCLMGALTIMALLLAAEVSEREQTLDSLADSLGARARAEHDLRQSEERFRLLSDSALDIVVEFDAERVVYLSPNLPVILGVSVESLLGQPTQTLLEAMIHPDDLPALTEQIQQVTAQRGEHFTATLRVRHHRGDWLWYESRVHSFQAVDGTLHVVSVNRDVTDRVRAEKEAARATEQFLQSQKLESLGVLAGGIAHDFNNLLAGMLANSSSVLAELAPESPYRPALRDVETLGLRASELIQQMLAYAGGTPLVTQIVDLSTLVAEMNVLLGASLSKKAKLRFELARDLPPVECDPSQVRQVVMNLLTNASEALRGEEGRIDVATRRVPADSSAAEQVELEVRDTGCGMDGETRVRMFDPFFTTKFTGRGLGLAAALGIVRRHQASIDVESEVGRGTVVRVRFAASAHPVSEAMTPSRDAWKPTGTVLVVEDEDELRTAVGRALGGAGFSVLSAVSGREALETFRERSAEIRVVLLDLTMPDLSGAEVLPALRAIRADVPIVVWSGYAEAEIARRLRGARPDGVLLKPSSLAELLGGLRKALERRP